MSTTVTYKGSTLATVNNNTKTLKTAGKYMEGDVILVDITDTPDFEELTVTPSDNTQVFTPYADAIIYTVPAATQLTSNPMTETVDLSFLTYGKQYKVTGMFYTRSHYRSSYSSDLVEFNTLWTASEDGEIAFSFSEHEDEHAHPIKITLSKTEIKVYYPDGTTISRGTIYSNSNFLTFSEKSCDAYSKVTVHAIPSQYIVPSGNLAITANGTGIDVTQYASVSVDVPTGSTINNQNKSVTPSESQQSITADSGYTGLGTVTVGAISSTYVGSDITRRSSTDLTVSGATVTVPAGYYSAAAQKSVTTQTLPTSLSDGTSGTLAATFDPTTSTKYLIISAGYYNTGYYKLNAMPSGSATAPTSISGTAASVSTGTNTLTLTKTVSVTPTVSAGYVSVGTAGNSSISLTANVTINPTPTASGATVTIPAGYYSEQTTKSISSGSVVYNNYIVTTTPNITISSSGLITATLNSGAYLSPTVTAGYITSSDITSPFAGVNSTGTYQMTTKAAATITPTTTNQTIAAGTYLTGTQTIAGDADLVGSNILSTANIFGVQGTVDFVDVYIRSAAPTSSVGNDGDIYIQE